MHTTYATRAKIIQWALQLLHMLPAGRWADTIRATVGPYIPRDNNNDVVAAALSEDEAFVEQSPDLHVPRGAAKAPPPELHPLSASLLPDVPSSSRKLVLMQFLKFERRIYSPHSQHPGNSQVMYTPSGEAGVVPGLIQYVIYVRDKHFFAVRRLGVAVQDQNPFVEYEDFPIELCSMKLGALELVPVGSTHITSHFAWLALTPDLALVFNLCQVSRVRKRAVCRTDTLVIRHSSCAIMSGALVGNGSRKEQKGQRFTGETGQRWLLYIPTNTSLDAQRERAVGDGDLPEDERHVGVLKQRLEHVVGEASNSDEADERSGNDEDTWDADDLASLERHFECAMDVA
jgi:hypothetical protein